jgi:putative redox protein
MANAKAVVTLEDGLQAKIDVRQFQFVSDEAAEDGGSDMGPSPPEIMLGSLGACAVITAKLYAQRKGWDLQEIDVALELERVDPADYPVEAGSANMMHVIRKQFRFRGDLSEEQKSRLVEIAGKCPVARVLQYPVLFEDTIVAHSEA